MEGTLKNNMTACKTQANSPNGKTLKIRSE